MNVKKSILPLLTLTLLASCLPDSKSGSKSNFGTTGAGAGTVQAGSEGVNQNEVIEKDGSNIQGFYAGDIIPLNYNLHFKKIGLAGVSREGDDFKAYVNMKYGPRGTQVKQGVYTGRRCPNIFDDLNKDAYIDMKESMIAIGQMTIPFDADVSSQDAGLGQYPIATSDGKYYYERMASFDQMFLDLKTPDIMPEDHVTKIPEDSGLTFPGRVVIFQGIPDSVPLPETIAVEEGQKPHDIMPVGCAILWKVKDLPPEFQSEGTTTTTNR